MECEFLQLSYSQGRLRFGSGIVKPAEGMQGSGKDLLLGRLLLTIFPRRLDRVPPTRQAREEGKVHLFRHSLCHGRKRVLAPC